MRWTLQQRVRMRLIERGWTQAELAAQVGISQGHLSRILSGHARASESVARALESVTRIAAEEFSRSGT